jgi:hypothetical protein
LGGRHARRGQSGEQEQQNLAHEQAHSHDEETSHRPAAQSTYAAALPADHFRQVASTPIGQSAGRFAPSSSTPFDRRAALVTEDLKGFRTAEPLLGFALPL